MSSADAVRKLLQQESRELAIEDLADGGAVVRDASAAGGATESAANSFPVSSTLYRCADLLANSGFAVALIRDEAGVYLNAR